MQRIAFGIYDAVYYCCLLRLPITVAYYSCLLLLFLAFFIFLCHNNESNGKLMCSFGKGEALWDFFLICGTVWC